MVDGDDDDPIISVISRRPAATWSAEHVKMYFVNPEKRRWMGSRVHPKCHNVVEYRRVGKKALYEFKFILSSGTIKKDPPAAFWLPYAAVRGEFPDAFAMLQKKGWRMSDYWSEYSDGEDVWDSDVETDDDEDLVLRRERRGSSHPISQREPRVKRRCQREAQ